MQIIRGILRKKEDLAKKNHEESIELKAALSLKKKKNTQKLDHTQKL